MKKTKNTEETAPSGITRKDAIKKMGKYAALTAIRYFYDTRSYEGTSLFCFSKSI